MMFKNVRLVNPVAIVLIFSMGFHIDSISSTRASELLATNVTDIQTRKFSFKSYLYDIEKRGMILNSYREITYHTFDFQKMEVIQRSKSHSTNEWKEFKYKIENWYREGNLTVLVVNSQGVLEIWFSDLTYSLGYDLADGQRLSFYELETVEK